MEEKGLLEFIKVCWRFFYVSFFCSEFMKGIPLSIELQVLFAEYPEASMRSWLTNLQKDIVFNKINGLSSLEDVIATWSEIRTWYDGICAIPNDDEGRRALFDDTLAAWRCELVAILKKLDGEPVAESFEIMSNVL